MRRFRFSIASLLGVVLFISVALAALRDPTDAWDSGILGLILLSLLTAILLTVHRTDRQRAYWLGFSLFGWVYLVASLLPLIGTARTSRRRKGLSATWSRSRPWRIWRFSIVSHGRPRWSPRPTSSPI